MATTYGRRPATDPDTVMPCPECHTVDAMRRTHDLTDGSESPCGEIWTCTECGAEYIDEW